MDNKTAYKLATVGDEYDTPIYVAEDKTPWYYEYYVWTRSDYPNIIKNLNYSLYQSYSFTGKLREELFDTENKINYIKGIFDSYSGEHMKDGVLRFANSIPTVYRVAKWIMDICFEKNILADISIKLNVKHGLIPMSNEIHISDDIINYINNASEAPIPSEYISWPEYVRAIGRDDPQMVEELYKINRLLTNKLGGVSMKSILKQNMITEKGLDK